MISSLDTKSTDLKLRFMTIVTSSHPLVWGELDVPLFGLSRDLAGNEITPPAGFSVVADPFHLWFIASRQKPALIHPKARPGAFQDGLWQYDVAELFLSDPPSGRYFEFNLAPNGSWWSCEFTAPRVRADDAEIAMPEVATYAEMSADGSWVAAMAIPLHLLKARLDFGPRTRLNVTMILESPTQRFLSAADLGSGKPDFHQPACFSQASFAAFQP